MASHKEDKKRYIGIAVVVLMFAVVAAMFVITQNQFADVNKKHELYNITKDSVEYVFSNNIYNTLNSTVIEDKQYIKNALDSPVSVVIAFNGSSAEDNSYFSVVSYNLVDKLKNYYVYSKAKIVKFAAIDLQQNKTISKGNTIIFFQGPNTGAKNSSVYYDNACVIDGAVVSTFSRCIIVQGTDYAGLVKASERLVLHIIDFNG